MVLKHAEVPLPIAWKSLAKADVDSDFRAPVREHAPYVWRVLRSFGVPEADLPDVSQETFITICRQLPSFEGRSSLRTWVYGVALRVAADYRGKAYRRRELVSQAPPEQISSVTPHAELERQQAWRLVETLLAGLSEEHRQVFVLYELEQLCMREVAEIVGCPLSTAYSRLNAARAAVQAALAAQGESASVRMPAKEKGR
jgi:RNA polymerase sigma-70 factor, ECF subfamily